MSNESHVMALLEEGNPATELGEHAWSHLDAAAYLATLHERSSEVTELKTRQPKTDDQSRRLVPALVAVSGKTDRPDNPKGWLSGARRGAWHPSLSRYRITMGYWLSPAVVLIH